MKKKNKNKKNKKKNCNARIVVLQRTTEDHRIIHQKREDRNALIKDNEI